MAQALAHVLAREGDPLVLPNGTVLLPDDERDVPKSVEQVLDDAHATFSAKTFKATGRRAVRDLPAAPGLVTIVGAVFMYTVLGVTDREICSALNITKEQLTTTRDHPAYSECFSIVVGEFINANSDLLVSRLAAHSHSALSKVVHLSKKGKKEETQLRASTDLLDRANVRPQDTSARQIASRNELRIVITKDEKLTGLELNGDPIPV